VLEHDVADGDEEGPPVLVERDYPHDDEVVEVHLDHAAGQMDEDGRARQQPEGGGDGAEAPVPPKGRRLSGQARDQTRLEQAVRKTLVLSEREQEEPGNVEP
jgi:hypothetical protein